MKVYQCDRCKAIFEPRILANGEPYISRKNNSDIDLCPVCYTSFRLWLLYKGGKDKEDITYDAIDGMPMISKNHKGGAEK